MLFNRAEQLDVIYQLPLALVEVTLRTDGRDQVLVDHGLEGFRGVKPFAHLVSFPCVKHLLLYLPREAFSISFSTGSPRWEFAARRVHDDDSAIRCVCRRVSPHLHLLSNTHSR